MVALVLRASHQLKGPLLYVCVKDPTKHPIDDGVIGGGSQRRRETAQSAFSVVYVGGKMWKRLAARRACSSAVMEDFSSLAILRRAWVVLEESQSEAKRLLTGTFCGAAVQVSAEGAQ